ncbi:unnamed protein product [Somion occarium]|uniref:Uncharacterized protein n=1 Tax=Somion occarium TaxID=3059160 RepID=A0ABP1CXQ5_9APHY
MVLGLLEQLRRLYVTIFAVLSADLGDVKGHYPGYGVFTSKWFAGIHNVVDDSISQREVFDRLHSSRHHGHPHRIEGSLEIVIIRSRCGVIYDSLDTMKEQPASTTLHLIQTTLYIPRNPTTVRGISTNFSVHNDKMVYHTNGRTMPSSIPCGRFTAQMGGNKTGPKLPVKPPSTTPTGSGSRRTGANANDRNAQRGQGVNALTKQRAL